MNEKRFNFTKKQIQELELPTQAKKMECYWDSKTRGLFLLVMSSGVMTFYVRRKVKGRSERLLIGRFPEVSVEQARSKAAAFHSALTEGKNLAQARRQDNAEITLGELFSEYIERHAKKSRKTWSVMLRDFDRYFKNWQNRQLSGILAEDVETMHLSIARSRGKYAANRAVELLRAVFNKGIRWRLFRGENPATSVTFYPEDSRNRILVEDEFARFFASLDLEPDDRVRDFIMLALLTGARKTNLLSMRWSDIHFNRCLWIIPADEAKNGSAETIALTPAELEILNRRSNSKKGPFVFAGVGVTGHFVEPKRAWKRILKRAGIADLHVHDLRHSMASWMANTGSDVTLIKSALNHKDIKTTMNVYVHTVNDAERKAREKAHQFMLSHKGKTTKLRVVRD